MRSLSIESPGSGVPLPGPRARRLIGVGIAAYLAWQVLVPLGYYRSENRRDERFAWRIFSALSIAPYRCDVRVQELAAGESTGRAVDLSRTLHDAWTAALRQGQDAVADRFLLARCNSGPLVEAVELARVCRRPDGGAAPSMRVRADCRSSAIARQEGRS